MSRASLLSVLVLVVVVVLGACGSAPTSVRVQIALGADATLATSPALLSLFDVSGRVLDGVTLGGPLPGDVVVLVDDDAGTVRADVRVTSGAQIVAEGDGRVTVAPRVETLLRIVVASGALADQDGDGVPDDLDDCPTVADPAQTGACPVVDMASNVDLAQVVDLAADLTTSLCGNGIIDSGEDCDDGANNSDGASAIAACTTHCRKRAPCGSIAGAGGVSVDPDTGHCYVAWAGPLTFTAGEADCLTRGGHLAAITSTAENQRVATLAFNAASWIGLVDPPAASPNVWTTTESNAFSAFRAGAPTGGANSCVLTLANNVGWEDRPCGWAAVGNLPASAPSTAAYVCENSCGNGVVDPGEQCDPPGVACTATCRTIRPCTETGGMTSPASGACYFAGATSAAYSTVLASGCPTGTHLATPIGPMETATALKAIITDSWIAVIAQTQPGVFAFDVAGVKLDTTRYHGFVTPDPDQATAPACAVISHGDARGDGWRDRPCTNSYTPICERD